MFHWLSGTAFLPPVGLAGRLRTFLSQILDRTIRQYLFFSPKNDTGLFVALSCAPKAEPASSTIGSTRFGIHTGIDIAGYLQTKHRNMPLGIEISNFEGSKLKQNQNHRGTKSVPHLPDLILRQWPCRLHSREHLERSRLSVTKELAHAIAMYL